MLLQKSATAMRGETKRTNRILKRLLSSKYCKNVHLNFQAAEQFFKVYGAIVESPTLISMIFQWIAS